MIKNLFIFIIGLTFFSFAHAQHAFRLKADILTKTRMPDSTFQISKGEIHYDKNIQKIIFDFTFPENEKVVLFDTTMFRYKNDQLVNVTGNFLIPNQSVFHSILSGNLTNFGFDEANFKAKGIEKQDDLVITTWLPPESVRPYLSKILVATRNKKLHSITMMGAEGDVLNRQILKKYRTIEGLDVPYEILIATYLEMGTMYQIIEMDNVYLNEAGKDKDYDCSL